MTHGIGSTKTLCLAFIGLVGLMAFTASAAHATGTWMIDGSALKGEEAVKGTGTGSVLISVDALGIVYHCSELLIAGSLTSQGNFKGAYKIDKCIVEGAYCTVLPIENSITGTLVLQGEDTYLVFSGEELMNIHVLGEECVLPENYPIGGSFAPLIGSEQEIQTLALGSEAPEASGAALFYGGEPVTFTASIDMSLNGTNKGKPWGAV